MCARLVIVSLVGPNYTLITVVTTFCVIRYLFSITVLFISDTQELLTLLQ